MRDEKRFAVLIDAENVSSKYIKYILDEISNYGIITYKRVYGDWTKQRTTGWKEVLLEHSITPIQQYSYTTGKNASDSAMIIDAMDILYSKNVEGFCLVSSDSDFTRLATRLRESGMIVIGMGEEKTPKPFSAACNIFKYLDILLEDENKSNELESAITSIANTELVNNKAIITSINSKEVKNMTDISIIEQAMIKIITDYGDDEKGIDAGELGSRLGKRYPDFDVRNYGYTKLSTFLTGFDSVELRKEGNIIKVQLKDNDINIKTIEEKIIKIISESKDKEINLGKLNQRLIEVYPEFNVRNYGYTKFLQFISDLGSLKVISSGLYGRSKKVRLCK